LSNPKQAVLLLAHGSPDSVDEIPEFLLQITGGRPLSPQLIEEVQHRYGLIGRSPLTVLTLEQGRLLSEKLGMPVYVGMRNWKPYVADAIKAMKFQQIFHTLPAEESAVSVVRAYADLVVELVHQDGSIVRARMSKSALLRGDDPVALATFQDLTEQLWVDEV